MSSSFTKAEIEQLKREDKENEKLYQLEHHGEAVEKYRLYLKKYYEEHKEYFKEYNRKYYIRNKEILSEYHKRYNKMHSKPKILIKRKPIKSADRKEYQRLYRESHKDYFKDYSKKYREEHKEYFKAYGKKYFDKSKENLKEYEYKEKVVDIYESSEGKYW